ncbi:MAG: phosphatidylglycerophosphatase A [Gammaproteobacteria bacterium]|nr:phosphatidylglycerophosphatase A [Gammaproteobacteria bacterium]MBI5616991.1 phosphatidylglycerophosphatase A [Gammaproteobacteria bacterium]
MRTVGPQPRVPVALLRDPGHFLALGFGAGLAPRAPGTFGTLAGLLVYWPLAGLDRPWYFAFCAVLFVVGVPICSRTARALRCHDHPGIVWDEVVGILVTLGCGGHGLASVAVGFTLFRLFDIWKPWPVRVCDANVRGGLGIMLDDVAAAIYAGAGLTLFEYISWS